MYRGCVSGRVLRPRERVVSTVPACFTLTSKGRESVSGAIKATLKGRPMERRAGPSQSMLRHETTDTRGIFSRRLVGAEDASRRLSLIAERVCDQTRLSFRELSRAARELPPRLPA